MTKLRIASVLLAYEVPLVVLAHGTKQQSKHPFIGLNYGDGDQSHLFYFAKVPSAHLDRLFEQKVDVRYLVSRLRLGDIMVGEVWGSPGDEVQVKPMPNFSADLLPETGMFIRHEPANAGAVNAKTVQIDGRWGIDDMSRFSDLVQDAYAFGYALLGEGTASTRQRMAALFRRYPWRGGFSSVNFFRDLYRLIPADDTAQIRRIKYASPGTIEFRMDPEVAESIRSFVDAINAEGSVVAKVYDEARDTLRQRGWLGHAKDDLDLTEQDEGMLLRMVANLANKFGLANQADEIVSFANSDPLGAVKILLAYYRRLNGLADYVATGKAQDLFA